MPIRLKLLALIATATTLVLATGASPLAAQSTTGWLTAEQKTRADALISVFENDTPVIQYDFHEILGDGRGITMGRGFTTATGDVLQVIKLYSTRVPANRLATYIPVLEQLEADGIPSDDSQVPAALGDDWAATARSDPAFRTAEDEVNDENAYQTAMQLADAQFGARFVGAGQGHPVRHRLHARGWTRPRQRLSVNRADRDDDRQAGRGDRRQALVDCVSEHPPC